MSGVHPLIHRRLGSVDVPIKVDDSQLALDVLRDALRVRESDAVITADNDRKCAGIQNVGQAKINLIKRLLDVRGNHEDLTGVPDCDFLEDVQPRSGLYWSYKADMRRTACGPSR
ncbi:MAG TPA: hypothetical protein VFO20_15220, partial [Propionibacteriaceae bacterium]|nr:hypothetical protein [Propionibacteriaceae bacterium]